MFYDILKFELNFHRRQNLVYVLFGVFFLLTFLATTTPNVQLVGGVSNLHINSPYTIMMTLGAVTFLALFGSVAFSANAVVRDFELGTAEFFFSSPVPKFDYVYGRFFGTLFYAYVIYFGGLFGMMVGEFMPWLDHERIGEFSLTPYLYTTVLVALPNLFVFSAIFFCVATVTRSMLWTYVGVMVLLALSFVLDTFTERDTVQLTSILDPFGTTALEEVTRYWTVFERNNNLPSFEGAFLANRLLWLAIGCGFLVAAYPLFPFSLERGRKTQSRKQPRDDSSDFVKPAGGIVIHQHFDLKAQLQQFFSQARLEVRNIVISAPFIVVLFLGLFLVVANSAGDLGNAFGTSVYPSTAALIQLINGAFSLSLLVVLIYYSGELMVRERSVKVNEIMDSMPYPNWIMIGAKLSGLIIVVVSMLLAAMVAAIGVQLYKEFYAINILQYLKGLLFFFQFPLYLMIVLAVFFYVLTRNKFISMFLMIMYFVVTLVLPRLGLEHYLYRLRELTPVYSDFTGYGHNLTPYLWQTLYWGLFGCLLLVVVHLMWPRGTEDDWPTRVRVMHQRMTQPVVIYIWAFSTAWLLVGGFIYYNTVILNPYVTQKAVEKLQARYEKTYKQYQYKTMPTITKIYAEVDFYPSRQELSLTGYYEMTNQSPEAIDEVHFSIQAGRTVNSLDVPGSSLIDDEELGYRIYKFDQPLLAGETLKVSFDIDWLTPGFANQGHTVKLTENGSFVNNIDFFPILGYSRNELQDNNKRREHDLPPLERFSKIDDEAAWQRNLFGERVDFETIVSTDIDQIAIAPGYIQKTWVEEDRRYFHYKMDVPIWPFFSFMSGDYEVERDSWNDVAIEVYYKHDYNIDTMILSAKNSLQYFSDNFSPYQYRQFRIVEFPAFQGSFAQSFPNTVPFSEAIGFNADLRDKKEIDYVYYVTAHEIAHQWWAHQVLGADVQGWTMIVETLAQYSALMVMEKQYGKDHMKRFLEFELDRYLRGRGGELIDEMPLFLVENQPYIHYRKGSVVLYALKDYVGEEVINSALATFIDQYAFKGAPYPLTRHLIALIRDRAEPKHEAMITELFEKIVLFDLKVADSKVVELENGQFEVTIDITARKFESDGIGQEVAVTISNWIDIGIMGEKDGETDVAEMIHLQKYEINQTDMTFTIVIDKKPLSVGIDPLNKLIDRNPDDNIKDV